jgi:hypothetical protein
MDAERGAGGPDMDAERGAEQTLIWTRKGGREGGQAVVGSERRAEGQGQARACITKRWAGKERSSS